MEGLKFGKLPATVDDRDITFRVVKAGITLPTPPSRFGHGNIFAGDGWKMLGNGPDETVAPGFGGAGDCVEAMMGHVTMEAAKVFRRHPPLVTGKESIAAYSKIAGYRVGQPATDVGSDMRASMKWWRDIGFTDGDGNVHKIAAFVSIDSKNWLELMQAAFVFSAVAIGFEFPDFAMEQFDHGEIWDVADPNPAIDGGHCVPVFGRSGVNVAGPVTWARRTGMTRAFYEAFNDETWAFIFPDELRNGKTERGMDLSQLNAELAAL